MKPSIHFTTAGVLAGGIYAATRSIPLSVGAFVGGFLIDIDHYFDYVVFNRQFSVNPFRFIDYYLQNRFRWLVLPLHSYELFAAQIVLAWSLKSPWLIGYLIGAALHMTLDLAGNGGVIDRVGWFYSFVYRARRGFEKRRLFRPEVYERSVREGGAA